MNKLLGLLLMLSLLQACSDSPSSSNTAPVSQAPAGSPTASPSPRTELDEALRYVRNGGYTYIWVVSRKDGKPLDGADGDFLRKNAPQVVDWVKVNDENKKFVGGTNFNLEEGNLAALQKRFVAEDYSAR